MSRNLPTSWRSTIVGSLRRDDAGSRTKLAGWVHRRRDLGGLIFIKLRDRSGRVQLSFGPEWTPKSVLGRAARLRPEDVIAIEGGIVARPQENVTPALPTGENEAHVTALRTLRRHATPRDP